MPAVDVAATDHDADIAVLEHLRVSHHRGEAGSAGALGDDLLLRGEDLDRVLDVGLADQQHVFDVLLEDRHRDGARALDGNAVGQRVRVELRRLLAAQRGAHRRAAFGLHAVDADRRVDVLGPGRHAGAQPAATDRDDQRVELRCVLEHLAGDRALAGDDQLVVVGMHEHQVVLLGQVLGALGAFGERLAPEHDLRAVAFGAFDLGERRG